MYDHFNFDTMKGSSIVSKDIVSWIRNAFVYLWDVPAQEKYWLIEAEELFAYDTFQHEDVNI